MHVPSIRNALAARRDEACLFQGQHSATGEQLIDLGDSFLAEFRRRNVSAVLSMAHDLRFLLALVGIVELYPLRLVLGRDAGTRAQAQACLALDGLLQPDGTWEWYAPNHSLEPAEAGVFLFTSGTTGRPNVAHHSWEGVIKGVSTRSLEKNRRACWQVTYQPHSFAALQVILSALLSGGSLVMPERRDLGGYLEAVAQHGVTHISATPTFWRAFLLAAGGLIFPSVKQISLGGRQWIHRR